MFMEFYRMANKLNLQEQGYSFVYQF